MGALAVLILVASNGSADPATSSLAQALEQAARRSVAVTVREVSTMPPEHGMGQLAIAADVDVVAEVDWDAASRARVHLHGRDGRVLRASELDFAARERGNERARSVGFAIATMLADEPVDTGIIASREAATLAAAIPAEREATADAPLTAAPIAAQDESPKPPEAPKEEPHPERRRLFGVEAAGFAASDANDVASAYGLAVRLSWNVTDAIAVRAGASPRWLTTPGTSGSNASAR